MKDISNDPKKPGTWKIELAITINFISSKDDKDKGFAIDSKTDNIKIMISDVTDEIMENLFSSLKSRQIDNYAK